VRRFFLSEVLKGCVSEVPRVRVCFHGVSHGCFRKLLKITPTPVISVKSHPNLETMIYESSFMAGDLPPVPHQTTLRRL
jgi:hypothetical protein